MNQNNNGNGNNQNPNRRWLGKIKNQNSVNGVFQKFLVDNPSPVNTDANGAQTPNNYYKGALIWIDAITGKKYHVKQMKVVNASPKQQQQGIVVSLCFDLDDEYAVTELQG